MIKEFPTLYCPSKTNKIKIWKIWIEQNKNNLTIMHLESGYVGGTIQDKLKIITNGKNIGKINETTPFEQAILEAKSKWNKKIDKNYTESVPDLNSYTPKVMLPMLAKGSGKGKIRFPCFMQPKLNGICNLSETTRREVLHHSRGGKLFNTVSHLDKYINKINPIAPLHGELFHPEWSLQKISSYTKELKEDSYLLQYWIYDIAWVGPFFKERWKWIIKNIPEDNLSPIKITPTVIVNSKAEVKYYHDMWVATGMEGGMLKNENGIYMFQYNSDDIEKVKEFMDAEFEIIGGKQATGTHDGCVIYTCKTKDGLEFDVSPRGSLEDRKQWFLELYKTIGKILTVRFSEFNESGIPNHPVGITIRDYE